MNSARNRLGLKVEGGSDRRVPPGSGTARGTLLSAAEARTEWRAALVVPLGRQVGRAGAGWAVARKKAEGGK